MKKSNFILLATLALAFANCKKTSEPNDPTEPIPVENVAQVAKMNQTLGWKIFNEEQKAKPGENVLISPFSIQTALFMAQNGAKSQTLAQILELMDCKNCSVEDLNSLHRDLTKILTEQSGHPKLTVANGFFYDKNRVSVKTPFLDATGGFYDCGSENLNFDAEQAALDKINGWVKTNTNGKIDKILDNISALDVAFLINALHFKADWATGFSPEASFAATFTKADGSEIPMNFINADRNFSFAQTANFNLVDIPFRDSTFSISFIQPSATNPDANWHKNISPEIFEKMFEGMKYGRAMVFFPKLKLAYENDLIESLKNLGVTDAFSESAADFTGMGASTAGLNIFINQIKHKSVLEVDEKGAEGAAVTSIGFGVTSLPPTFWFNRPFVLVLRHLPSGALIFTGFVADPA